jgi:hypothetical protein
MVGTTSQMAAVHAWFVHVPLQHCEPNMHAVGLLSGMQQRWTKPDWPEPFEQSSPPQQSESLRQSWPGKQAVHLPFLHSLPKQHSLPPFVQLPPDE